MIVIIWALGFISGIAATVTVALVASAHYAVTHEDYYRE